MCLRRMAAALLLGFLAIGCGQTGTSATPRSFASITYQETNKDSDFNDEIASRFDKQYVRWTARVRNISGKHIRLGAEGLAEILATFPRRPETTVGVGEPLTVSCLMRSTAYTLGTWVLDDCRVEPTLEADSSTLAGYEQDLKDLEAQLARVTRISNHDYIGLNGYVVVRRADVFKLADYDRKFPAAPWGVPIVKQVGDYLFEATSDTVPHKTQVRVVNQMIGGYPGYNGAVEVEIENTPDQRVWVDRRNFGLEAYWEQAIDRAVEYGPLVAVYNGQGKKPHDRQGKWVEVAPGTEVVAEDLTNGLVQAKVYQQWRMGYGGVVVYFAPESLDIRY